MDCTNLRESTEVERMVSVRPRRNMRSDALSYVAQARPYILGQRGERQPVSLPWQSLVCASFSKLTCLSLSVRRLRNDLWVVLPVVCQLQGQLDKSIRAYLLWLGETLPKLMEDHDFDIQIFNHSTRKERGTVPLCVAHSCNTVECICFLKAQREQAIWIWPMQGQRAPEHIDHFGQHHRGKNFWPLLKISTRLDGHMCVYTPVFLAGSSKALLFLSKWDESVITLFWHLWPYSWQHFSAQLNAVEPRSHWENSLAAWGKPHLNHWQAPNGDKNYSLSHPHTSPYSHVEVLLCLLYVILDFWGDVKPQLFGHWQMNCRRFARLGFLPAQRNGSVWP